MTWRFNSTNSSASSWGSSSIILLGQVPGRNQQFDVASQVGNSQRWHPALFRAEQITGAAHSKIGLGELESIVGLFKNFQSFVFFGRSVAIGKDANVAAMRTPRDTSAELMQLSQSESLGPKYGHDCRIGNVNADFDHGCADQDL